MLIFVLLILPFRNPFIDLGQTVGYPIYKFWSNRISLGEHYLGDAFRIAGDTAVVAGTKY